MIEIIFSLNSLIIFFALLSINSKSLADFLSFKEENPKENFVYVLQHPPANINILGASDFGYLVICLPNFGPDEEIYKTVTYFLKNPKLIEKQLAECEKTLEGIKSKSSSSSEAALILNNYLIP